MTTIPQIPAANVPADAVLLDVRETNEFEAGHVPGATHIALGELRERVADIPAGNPLYLICRSGSRSQKAAEFLTGQGLSVANVVGGTTAWVAAGLPLETVDGRQGEVVAPMTPPPATV